MTNEIDDKRIHGIEAASAGDLGSIANGELLGPCPSCRAELRVVKAENPLTGKIERGLVHPVPFCSYFGDTNADAIERAARKARQ